MYDIRSKSVSLKGFILSNWIVWFLAVRNLHRYKSVHKALFCRGEPEGACLVRADLTPVNAVKT